MQDEAELIYNFVHDVRPLEAALAGNSNLESIVSSELSGQRVIETVQTAGGKPLDVPAAVGVVAQLVAIAVGYLTISKHFKQQSRTPTISDLVQDIQKHLAERKPPMTVGEPELTEIVSQCMKRL
jgi:hypothetical protein